MNGRKGLSLVLSGAMMVSMLSFPAMAADTAAPEFPDAASSWASESIDRWGAAGVVNGDENGNFNPTASITRAELAQIFVNMFGLTEKAPNTYADLRGDEWYADAILKCTAAGIMQGDGVNANPTAMISRQETMVMFGRAMGVIPAENPDMSGFTDGASVADWAAGYMSPLAEMGIISGSGDGSIQPSVNIDRASTMALLDKAITVYINEPGEYSVDNQKGFVVVAANGEVKLTGKTAGVVVTAGCGTGTVKLSGITADTVKVDGTAAVSLEDGAAVETVSINAASSVTVASGVKVETMAVNADADVANAGTITTLEANSAADVKNTGTIRTLDAGAAVRVDNSGTISRAEIKADGVILDGRRPSAINVADGVKNPTDSEGNEIKDNTGNGGGGDYNPPSTETVGGIVGVNPVDQSDAPITEMPTITASAYKTVATGVITIDLSSSGAVPVHENAQHAKGSWVGFAIKAPEGVTSAYYTFGTEASDTASSSVELTTGDPSVGGGAEGEYYFVAFVNATAVTPKTHLTIDWDGQGETYAPQKYEINLASVKTNVQSLENVTTSLDKLPDGVSSSETGLSWDGSTALVSNGGSGALTQEQVKGMGGGGEYTVYYAVPQEGLEFDKIVRTVNGRNSEWALSSGTAADAGAGWWTKDESSYYFKWGAVFAQKNAQGIWEMTDNGKYEYTIRFVKDENVVASYSFTVDLSGYAIEQPGEKAVSTAEELTAALAECKGGETIRISGTIGSEEAYGLYTVDVPVIVEGGTVYGSFVLKKGASGSEFNGVTINNRGDDAGGEHRNAINAYVSGLTVDGCTFNSGSKFANGIMILPSSETVNYRITGNTFNGYQNGVEGWSTTAILITSGYTMSSKAFFEADEETSAETDMDNKADLAIITGNTFVGCKNDYTRNTLTGGTKIYCTANSASDNFRLSSGTEGSMFYVTGNVTRESDTTVPAGSTLTVAEGKTLTIDSGVALTVNGALAGTVVGKDSTSKLVLAEDSVYGDMKAGTYAWSEGAWKADAATVLQWALAYQYDPAYEYTNKPVIEGATVTYTGSLADFTDNAEEGNENPTRATADLARLLGAIWRVDEGKSVSVITYSDKAYTWNAESGRKGSNWENDGTTLISAVADAAKTGLSDGSESFSFTINSEEATLVLKVSG